MGRGGRRKDRDGPERRCIVTGESRPAPGLIRFALGPDGAVVPDVAGRLPGRGVWLGAERALAETAVKKRLFNRAFRREVSVPEGLPDLLERMLAQRLIETVSLARKAGAAVTGFEKVRERVRGGRAAVILAASDGAEDGKTKIAAQADGLPIIGLLTAAELGLAFGRDFAIHAALDAGGLADRALTEADRLTGFRASDKPQPAEMRDATASGRRHQDKYDEAGPIGGPGQDD